MKCDRKPNLLIAGVNKAGTTSLFTYLSSHPDICTSDRKETHYFSPLVRGEPLPPFEDYLRHFAHCRAERYVLEASPHYLFGGARLAQVLLDRLDEPRVMIMLRNPVNRLISLYRFKKSGLKFDRDVSFETFFQDCLERQNQHELARENVSYRAVCYWSIQGGLYAEYLEEWFELFRDRLRVLFFEDMQRDEREFLKGVCDWLGIDSQLYDEYIFRVENKTRNFKFGALHRIATQANWKGEAFWRRHPVLKRTVRSAYNLINSRPFDETVSESSREELEHRFAPANERLARLLARQGYTDLPPWLSGSEKRESVS